MKGIVIIISNNESILDYSKALEKHGYSVIQCLTDEQFKLLCKKEKIDLVILDSSFFGLYLINLLKQTLSLISKNFFFLILNENNSCIIAECFSLGISDYIVAPCSKRYFLQKTLNILRSNKRKRVFKSLASNMLQRKAQRLTGTSNEILNIREKICNWVEKKYPVLLLLGESGTGKNFIAEIISEMESLKKDKFLIVNCAAIPESLAESELFGSVKGAFTDSVDKKGLFEVVDGGILFLDEINELSLVVQAKLLHAVETCSFLRVGGVTPIKVNIRLICATNANIQEYVYEKRFRFDLYNRISMYQITLPPLRDRKEDIIPLSEIFLQGSKYRISNSVQNLFMHYSWPGNIRELHKVLANGMAVCKTDTINICDITLSAVLESPPEDY